MYMDKKKSPQIENSAEITLIEFADLVRQMRHNQRRYLAHRRPEVLETCKRLEYQVDSVINKLFDAQLKIF